jgi:hypothetical protein
MTATGATLLLDKAVSGVGTLALGTGGTLSPVEGSDVGQTVDFLGSATLDLSSLALLNGQPSTGEYWPVNG